MLRSLCNGEGQNLPYSVREFIITGDPHHFNGRLNAGDVDCAWEVDVRHDGFWSVKGNFHDGGALAGDFFFAEFLLDEDSQVGVRLEGSILDVTDSRDLSLEKHGVAPWIRKNWQKIEGRQPSVRLYAAPAWASLLETLSKPIVMIWDAANEPGGEGEGGGSGSVDEGGGSGSGGGGD